MATRRGQIVEVVTIHFLGFTMVQLFGWSRGECGTDTIASPYTTRAYGVRQITTRAHSPRWYPARLPGMVALSVPTSPLQTTRWEVLVGWGELLEEACVDERAGVGLRETKIIPTPT